MNRPTFENKHDRLLRQSKQWRDWLRKKKKECSAIYERSAKRELLNINVMEILNP